MLLMLKNEHRAQWYVTGRKRTKLTGLKSLVDILCSKEQQACQLTPQAFTLISFFLSILSSMI